MHKPDESAPKPARGTQYAVSIDKQMHEEIVSLSEQYSRDHGFHVSYRAVVRMALSVFRLHRDRKAARDMERWSRGEPIE